MLMQKQSGALATCSGKHQHRVWDRRFSETPSPAVRPAVLPALKDALDSATMTTLLRPWLVPITEADHELTVTHIDLLDYKAGQRGLVRYELSTSPRSEPYTIFGKVYADPSQLARVDQVLHTLWADVFGADPNCGVPQPLGVIPELSMLLYLPAQGQFLDEVLASEHARSAMRLTARWLATLHHAPLQVAKQFQLAGELANLAAWAALVGQTYPELAALAQQAFDYLQEQATGLPLATQTPIHKDFHYRHVLVGRGIKVIDFDELRLGDPNFDLAHFCANLHLLSYRQHGSPHRLRSLEQRFLDAYARYTGWTLTRHLPQFTYFYVYTCLKLARQLCLGFGPSPIPGGNERQRQVQLSLRQGIAAISMN